LTNRRFEITSANNYLAQIYNNSAQAFTIHSDLLVSGTNTKTLELGGTGAGTSTFAGDLSNGTGTLLLNKSGTSTWVLSGDNTYTGATTVSAGSLIINGDQSAATGAVAVNGTSTLGGSGTTGGTITVAAGAKLAPGNAGVGNLATGGGLNISAMAGGAGTLVYELNSTAASDKITVAGTLNIGSGTLGLGDFAFTNLGGMSAGTYKLITGASPVSGTLDAANTTGTLDDFDLELAINGNDIELVVTGGPDNDFTDWAATFLPTVIGSPLDDHDGDGLSNDEERAFGLNPTSGSSSNPISVPLDTTNGTFTFTRRDPTISGLTYQVWTSTDLADWEVDGGAVFTPGTVVDQVEPVAVQLSAGLLSEPKLFFRITYAEPVPAPPLLSVDFEANAGGFTVATLGGTPWAHGAPNSPSLGGGAITSGAGGSTQCWGTNLTGGYAASTDTSLRSPVIDLTSVTAATLSFAQAIDSNSGHTLEVNIIDDTTDTVIANIIPATQDGNTSVSPWETVAPVALPGAAYGQAVRIEWRFIGNGDGTYNGAYIDDVTVLATP
jgi:autotransporter-associated beta strand protein